MYKAAIGLIMCAMPFVFIESTLAQATFVSASATDGEGCLVAPEKPDAAAVQLFLNDPQAILVQYPTGGAAMVFRIRRLAISDPAALSAIAGLFKQANAGQLAAIGAGLGAARGACEGQNPALADAISAAVVAADIADLTTAFMTAINDLVVADLRKVSGGDGGAFAVLDSSILGAPNNFGFGGDETTPQTSVPFSTGRAGGAFAATPSPVLPPG